MKRHLWSVLLAALLVMLMGAACDAELPVQETVVVVATETPSATEEVVVTEEPSATEEPALDEAPTAIELPVETKEPVPTEELAETEEPAETAEPTVEPTTEPTTEPTAEPEAELLPAPLYFINAEDDQVWRIEADGETMAAVTAEDTPITDFDVNPADSSLALVAGNAIILAGPGEGRTELVSQPEVAEDDYAGQINETVGYPTFSPDGSLLVYGLGGVHLVDLAAGSDEMLIESDPYPEAGEVVDEAVRFFSPNSFSPDGSLLLVDFGYYPEAGGMTIYDLGDGVQTEITLPDTIVCCQPVWAPDSSGIYLASPYVGMVEPGLWFVPAETGGGQSLISSRDGLTFHLVGYPHPLDESTIQYFYAEVDTMMDAADAPLTMVSAPLDHPANHTALRDEPVTLLEALWAPDGSGAVIVAHSGDDRITGELIWLSADGGAEVPLGVEGRLALHWGQ